jgi:hypothetical protein
MKIYGQEPMKIIDYCTLSNGKTQKRAPVYDSELMSRRRQGLVQDSSVHTCNISKLNKSHE